MSVSIATGGMFNPCCGGRGGGGGAPPAASYGENRSGPSISVSVRKVSIKKSKTPEISISVESVKCKRIME